jgi:hypothetical protein
MLQENAAVADAIQRTTGSTKKANDAWNEGVRRIKQHLVQMGLTPAAAQKVIDKLGGVKDAVKNVPKLAEIKIAALGTDAVLNALSLIDGKIVSINGEEGEGQDHHRQRRRRLTSRATGTRRRRSASVACSGARAAPPTTRTSPGSPTASSSSAPPAPSGSGHCSRPSTPAVRRPSTRAQRALRRRAGGRRDRCPRRRRPAGHRPGRRPMAGCRSGGPSTHAPVVVMQPPQPDPPAGGGKTTIVDADGALIGTMRTAATRTARSRSAPSGSAGSARGGAHRHGGDDVSTVHALSFGGQCSACPR